jgi:hypothetical protein
MSLTKRTYILSYFGQLWIAKLHSNRVAFFENYIRVAVNHVTYGTCSSKTCMKCLKVQFSDADGYKYLPKFMASSV